MSLFFFLLWHLLSCVFAPAALINSRFCGNLVCICIKHTAHCCRRSSSSGPLLNDSFAAHYRPTLCRCRRYRMEEAVSGGRGGSCYKAKAFTLAIGWWDPFNLLESAPVLLPLALPTLAASKQCAVSVPERISALRREEERISASTHPVCTHVRAAASLCYDSWRLLLSRCPRRERI